MPTRQRLLAGAAYATPFLVFLAVYAPAAGHGFISDDFSWILHNRIRGVPDLSRIALSDNGFYRPVVAFSFAANELVSGLDARAFGLTNLALAMLVAAAVYLLGRAVSLPTGAAAFGAALWLLNLHGTNMAVLWISGRTALLATAFAAGCMAALLRGYLTAAAVLLALAVFSREDAALLPVVTSAWACLLHRHGLMPRAAIKRWVLISAAVTVAYFAIRSFTGAMTPATAPAYYQFTTSARVLLRNAAEYADRTMTLSLAALVVMAVVVRPRRPAIDPRAWTVVVCGAVWTAAFLIPALLLPVRSSLYACLPSVGVCVAIAAVAERWWAVASAGRRGQVLVCAVLVPLLLWPVYHARTRRWVEMAEFSARALAVIDAATRRLPDDADILIVDDRSRRASMASVFSTMVRDAFLATTGRYMNFYVQPPIANASPQNGGGPLCDGCIDLELSVVDGRLVER